MRFTESKKVIPAVLVIAAGFFAVFFLSRLIGEIRPPLPAGYEDENLAIDGAKLKNFTFGLNGLIADLYWMNSLQYLGGKFAKNPDLQISIDDLSPLDPKLLYPMLNTAADYDPRFFAVYEFGATVLPAIDPALAVRIVEKAIAANPHEWRLYNHLGYIYWRLENYEKAAAVYSKGALIDGAPPYLLAMSVKMKGEGGSRETARAIYEEMLRSADDSQTRGNARLRLQKLDSLEEQDLVNLVLQKYRIDTGRCIETIRQILPILAGEKLNNGREFGIDAAGNLTDPTGAPYILDQSGCTIRLDNEKTKLPVN